MGYRKLVTYINLVHATFTQQVRTGVKKVTKTDSQRGIIEFTACLNRLVIRNCECLGEISFADC